MSAEQPDQLPVIRADFAEAAAVTGVCTTRRGGVSEGPYASLNLASHVGDDMQNVQENRRRLAYSLHLPSAPVWLDQCHGSNVALVDELSKGRASDLPVSHSGIPVPRSDAAVTRQPGTVLAILTADCLPVLMYSPEDRVIGAAHAGWRGLAGGVLENTVAAMQVAAGNIHAWIGPAIGPGAFEVGAEVRAEFLNADPDAESCFVARGRGKWLANLPALAKRRLNSVGVSSISGGGRCSFTESGRFFSYRRDGECGRMASLLWMHAEA